MRLKDKKENFLMGKPEYFADFINGCIYHGEQILRKENIREIKQVYSVIEHENAAWSVIRDVVMEMELEAVIILIGLENQSKIHYAMPLKVMKSDIANYMEQLKKISISHKEKKELLSGAEYLSGFAVNDKLIPVLTYCIYWGEEEWNGPRCLKDMMDLDNMPEEIIELIGDYPLNLIEVNKFEHPEYFRTDLRIIFEFLKNRGDYKAMKSYILEHENDLNKVHEEAFDLMCELSNERELKKLKEKYRNEEGVVKMCRAFEEWARIERSEGKNEGFELAKKILVMHKNGASESKIAEICEVDMEKVSEILSIS